MKSLILLPAFFLVGILGCRENLQDRTGETTAGDSTHTMIDAPTFSSDLDRDPEIVNSFGMKFVCIDIDPNVRVQSEPPYPAETYYIQETEISGKHLDNLRAFAKTRNIGPSGYMNIPMSQWRDYSDLAEQMSKYDPHYDYRLPTKSEWVFACMSGYEQRCEEKRPNSYGIDDMLDGDVEAIDDLSVMNGHEYGVLMGRWINNWGEHTGKSKPDCPCEHWTLCNPDADDSLDEIIVGRFILLPEGTVRTTDK